ncbi:MAG: thioredoxin family protein [Pseudonocardiaceae bacterium]
MRTVTCENCGRVNRVPAAAQGKPRCGNCKAYLPWITDAGDDDFAQIAERASVPVLVDSRRLSVQAVPTLMVLNRGEVIARRPGAAPVDALRRWLDGAIARIPATGTSSDDQT